MIRDYREPEKDPVFRRIVGAARTHYFASGFRGVTMDDLAAELGMSKKTLYAHFPSKTALLDAVLEAKFDDVNADMREVIRRNASDFSATLHGMLGVMTRHIGELQPAFLRDVRRAEPEVFAMIEKRRSAVFSRYFDYLIRQGRKAGVVRKDIAVKFLVEMLLGAVRSIMNPAKLGELRLAPQAALSAIVAVMLEGVVVKPSSP